MSGYFSKFKEKFSSESDKRKSVENTYKSYERGLDSIYGGGSEKEESVIELAEVLGISKERIDATIKEAAQNGYNVCIERLRKGERYTETPTGAGTRETVDNYEFAKNMADRLGLGYEELDKLVKPEAIKKDEVKKEDEYQKVRKEIEAKFPQETK